MALKAILDSLEGVEEHYQTLYTQQNDKFVLTGVEGMKPEAEFAKVHGGLTKERNDHKGTKERLAGYSALGTLEEIQSRLDRVAELEAAAGGKLDETGINKLVETRIGTKTAPLEREINTLKQGVMERDNIINQYKAKETQRTITDNLREAAKKSGLLDTADRKSVV